ncbi:Transcription factor Dp-2, partial [Modicella reniformis]
LDEEGQGQDGAGAQSLHGKGLGYYAPLVCARVEARGVTTYNDLVNDLAGGQPGERPEGTTAQEQSGQGNIRRRVYDALNILEALGIIVMDKKEIRWIGQEDAKPIREISRRVLSNGYSASQQQERDGADESEEPEDDDMDIEQLQKEVEAMELRNALEEARFQDQVARYVQVKNVIERNKLREQKELERQMRRKQRKEEKRAQTAVAAGAGEECKDIQDDSNEVNGVSDETLKRSERRHHRHHRHRSPRLEKDDEGEGEDEEDRNRDKPEEEVDEETAQRIRKMERKERRERKEKRAQRRLEKEAAARENEERIQLPFVIMRVPGYAGQSSDSEASISVVRRVREEQRPRKSGKSKRHDGTGETTMVEIKMPHQEELSIISDTEILGDLGLSEVPLSELKTMLTQEALNRAGYTTTSTTMDADGSADNVMTTVRGGFERALVCAQ